MAYGGFKYSIEASSGNPDKLTAGWYADIIDDQVSKGIIEPVTNNSTVGQLKHYIPHHAVISPSKVTTKVRVVYDASAKVKSDSKSLNDCLYRGPVLLHNLCGLLIRFRTHKIALLADIEKAFLQVGLQSTDRDVTRFLWLKNPHLPHIEDNLQIYRFCRVPFGVVSSPFLLAATVEHHLDKNDSPIAQKLKQNLYVDNVVTGCDTLSETKHFYTQSKELFQGASMNLREWSTNLTELNNHIPQHDLDKRTSLSVLGITWVPSKDELSISKPKYQTNAVTLTKREILKILASLFDPLGYFSHMTLAAKLFLQELWTEKFDWDDILPETKQTEWKQIFTTLQLIPDINIPRFIGQDLVTNTVTYQLLCFCDASSVAYATLVYLRVSSESCVVNNLVYAKTRLAPVKKTSIPRLELLAIVIGVRALTFVHNHLHLTICQKTLWTDSQCVLQWINTKSSLSAFVENRIHEIKTHSDINFKYISTKENPADLATRGKHSDFDRFDLWWHGPDWMCKSEKVWPNSNVPKLTNKTLQSINSETKPAVLYEAKLSVQEQQNSILGINMCDFSSVTKLHRVTAWVLRFIGKLQHTTKQRGPLTCEELQSAKLLWIKSTQSKHFTPVIRDISANVKNKLQKQLGVKLDSDGVLRCHGRLSNAELSYGAISPILLPKHDPYTKLVISRYHQALLHSGVSQTLSQLRHEYWIPQGRSSVKRCLRECIVCRRQEGGPYKMPAMPQLPKQRVTQSTPFTYTGLDYLGPLFIREETGVRKVWICLFTCMAVRAVHLELVKDMTTDSFLLCLRRFVSRHGVPSEIISDNAPQFKLAKNILDNLWKQAVFSSKVQRYVADKGIVWKFIVELSPWMGGFYERLVGLVKRTLRKSIGKSLLTFDQLLTFTSEAETIINSRPLVYLDDDINSNVAISPNDFLVLNPNYILPETDLDISDPDFKPNPTSVDRIIQMWKKGHKHLEKLWTIWQNEYLLSLRERSQINLKSPRVCSPLAPCEGDVVLIKDNLPRSTWKLGRIHKLLQSRDGQVRAAELQLPSRKLINRPLSLLYPIECHQTSTILKRNTNKQTCDRTNMKTSAPRRQAAIQAKQLISQQLR